MKINKTKSWWGFFGFVVLVLVGVNTYLFKLKASIYEFVDGEVKLDSKRVEYIRELRQEKPSPHLPAGRQGLDY